MYAGSVRYKAMVLLSRGCLCLVFLTVVDRVDFKFSHGFIFWCSVPPVINLLTAEVQARCLTYCALTCLLDLEYCLGLYGSYY